MKTIQYISLLMLLTVACSEQKQNVPAEKSAINPVAENDVVLTPEQVSAINIQTGHIAKVNMKNVIKANGYFDVPPQNNAVVSPMIPGYVRQINFLIGDNVKKGQVLAELESMEFIDIQQQYVEINARLAFLKEEYDRQILLQEKDAISRKQFLTVEADYKTTLSMMDGLKSKLSLIGVNFEELGQGKIEQRFFLRSPITGSVKKMNTVVGRFAAPPEELYEIVDTDHLHIELNVYEKDVLKVKKGQKVWFKVPSQATTIYEGEVFLVGQDLSEDKRAINVHVHIHGNTADFTVGMYANASIVIEDNPSLTLPVTAIVTVGTNKYLFKKESTSADGVTFKKVQVFTGIESEGLIELTGMDQLTEEDEIVTDGAFYLLNAFSGNE
ncbi:MAG: efflux RND transporter periplasmic adaptor subunit [Cyclobacteriaceae bacterium]|nr:efflux RND transporter periplasmic adaptor subunit [Cyclobacteriaceae bacterium]